MKTNKLINFFLILVLLLVSCEVKEAPTPIKAITEPGFKLEDYDFDFKFPEDEVTIRIADGLLGGELTVHRDIESVTYKPDDIDWDMLVTQSPSTFQLYLQALHPIVFLTKAYQLTGKDEYLDLAGKIIDSWIEYENDLASKKNNMVWYDHGTALRAENIIFYLLTEIKFNKPTLSDDKLNILTYLLKDHAEILKLQSFYTPNHNHGIFQDRSLMYIAYFLDDEDMDNYMEIVKTRLLQQFTHAFNEEGVHVENSTTYHIGVLELFRTISDFLNKMGDNFGDELNERLDKSLIFLTHMTKPNGELHPTGDSFTIPFGTYKSDPTQAKYNNQEYLYASTQGMEGIKPRANSIFYPKSGYYMARSTWQEGEDYKLATWTMFKSGYSSSTHKHADDTSFVLYSKGYDIFVDTGMYNYSYGDKYRDYFISANAHNMLIVDEKSYSPTEDKSNRVGMLYRDEYESYDRVLAYNDMWRGVMHDREFINLGDAILIVDDIVSKEMHKYSQLFQCSEGLKPITIDDNEILFELKNSPYNVRIRQLIKNKKIKLVKGDFNKSKYGYISRQINKVDSIYTVLFEEENKSTRYISLITIEDKFGKVKDIDTFKYNEKQGNFSFIKNGKKEVIQIRERKRLDLSVLETRINEKEILLTNKSTSNDFPHAYYIIETSNNHPIYKGQYSYEKNLKLNIKDLNLNEAKEYKIRGYMKNDLGQRYFKTIDLIKFEKNKGKWVSVSNEKPSLNFVFNQHKVDKVANNKYKFKLDIDYAFDYYVLWYIYRNGSYYESTRTNNKPELEYTFNEDGSYAVIYKIYSENGEEEVFNFPILRVNK